MHCGKGSNKTNKQTNKKEKKRREKHKNNKTETKGKGKGKGKIKQNKTLKLLFTITDPPDQQSFPTRRKQPVGVG